MGVRAWPLRKNTVFEALKKSGKNLATKLERGGGKALVAGPLKKDRYFFAASLTVSLAITVPQPLCLFAVLGSSSDLAIGPSNTHCKENHI